MKILVINGGPRKSGFTKKVAETAFSCAKKKSDADFLDLSKGEVETFVGFGAKYGKKSKKITTSLKDYDGFVVCSPVYNASFSSAIKNLFEHADYKALKGKFAGIIVVAGGTLSYIAVQIQLTTLLNYFGIFTNPGAVFMGPKDFDEKKNIKKKETEKRMYEMLESTIKMGK